MATLLVLIVMLPLTGSLFLFLSPRLDMKKARAGAFGDRLP